MSAIIWINFYKRIIYNLVKKIELNEKQKKAVEKIVSDLGQGEKEKNE